MRRILLDLEKDFFKLNRISDREWLDAVLHDDFKECGKSGALFDKQTAMKSLLACNKDRNIKIYNFEYTQAGDKCWIVHYITISGNEKYYRTSVWVGEKDLRLLFHQATRLTEDVLITEDADM